MQKAFTNVVNFLDELQLEIHGPNRIKSGRALSLTCSLLEGTDATFSWFIDGRVLRDNDRTKIFHTVQSSILTISDVSNLHSGEYSCLAGNEFAEERSSKYVVVEGTFNDYVNLW